MAQKTRIQPGSVANIFIRCLLSDAGQLLGGLSNEQWSATVEYFEHRCPYSDVPITEETAVQDHAIPINRQHCGLHLYGNILPCAHEANARKHHKHFRDFVTDPQRLQKIEEFIEQSGYWEKAAMLGDLEAYCRTQYDVVTGLCARNKDYLNRITEGNVASESPASPTSPLDIQQTANAGTLPISLTPSPASVFKEALLRNKRAWITVHYEDGRQEVSEWTAENFKATSNVLGNLRTRPNFRQGAWQKHGIRRVSVTIDRPQ
ncbi:MAG: hypothetical protein KDB14_30695 [Planctomycetales bacterium]|nr:hypothetical protein [Planctomycetales bacterium]